MAGLISKYPSFIIRVFWSKTTSLSAINLSFLQVVLSEKMKPLCVFIKYLSAIFPPEILLLANDL